MLSLIFSLFVTVPDPAFEELAFKKFKRTGDKPVCMVHYQTKIIECKYDTMNDCRNDYANNHVSICFPRKSLKLDEDKK